MGQDKQIAKIVERWKRKIPPEEDVGMVWKVVKHFFPESEYLKGKSGSHLYKVIWPEHAALAKALGQTKLEPFEFDNAFMVPVKKGRWIKGWYIREVVKAIEWKEMYDEIRSEKSR